MTVEYFDNLGASQTLAMSFTPTVPAAGNPADQHLDARIVDQASGLPAGIYQIVFGDGRRTPARRSR